MDIHKLDQETEKIKTEGKQNYIIINEYPRVRWKVIDIGQIKVGKEA